MFGDITAASRTLSAHLNTPNFRRELQRLGKFSTEIINNVVAAGDDMEQAARLVLVNASTKTPAAKNPKDALAARYDLAVACTLIHAVLVRFVTRLLLQPPTPQEGDAYITFFDVVEADFPAPIPLPTKPSDLLGALADALNDMDPVAAVTELVSREVASRLELDNVNVTLRARVRRFAGRFIVLALEDFRAQCAERLQQTLGTSRPW